MKLLIFSLILVSGTLSAADELVDPQDGKQFVGVLKNFQVGEIIQGTSHFNECTSKNKFDAKADDETKKKNAEAAVKCFQDKLKDRKAEEIDKLAENLQLPQYGLVQSKNVKDIQQYLSNRMYQTLTGVNLEEQSLEKKIKDMSFKNKQKKLVDQKLFFDLYRTQLGKNALYEISRFCFQNLRRIDPDSKVQVPVTDTNFIDYWKNNPPSKNVEFLTDQPAQSFGSFENTEDKSAVYESIFKSIQSENKTQLDEKFMSQLFMGCGDTITPLCKKFETDRTQKIGANACLVKARLVNIRKALSSTEKLSEEIAKWREDSNIKLSADDTPPVFKAERENSLDNLTNESSLTMLEGGGGNDGQLKSKMESCEKEPELTICENFVSVGDDLQKAEHDIDMEMQLKKELAIARVKALKDGDKKSLKEYLEDNGYFELANKSPEELTPEYIEEEIGKSFDAKKDALILEMKNKLGNRQITEGEDLNPEKVKVTIKETKEERARLAQVVLFNNIISSYITVERQDSKGNKTPAGRNVRSWEKEEKTLTSESIDPTLFSNITTNGAGSSQDADKMNFDFIDNFLGKKEEKPSN